LSSVTSISTPEELELESLDDLDSFLELDESDSALPPAACEMAFITASFIAAAVLAPD